MVHPHYREQGPSKADEDDDYLTYHRHRAPLQLPDAGEGLE